MNGKRSLTLLFLSALVIGALGIVFIVTPREPGDLRPGESGSFRYSFDPHLFLTLDEVSVQSILGGTSVTATLTATNTAAGDMTIDLSRLRVALVDVDGVSLEPHVPAWLEGGSPAISRNDEAGARIELQMPQGPRPQAILVWEDSAFLRLLPFARGSILCPTLRMDLGSAAEPQPLR